ncbi:MAG: DUF4136 domain-containing protein [Croceibacterium sp.]
MQITSTFGRAVKVALVSLALAGLAACESPFNANVSHFSSQLPAPTGQTFTVVAEDPALANGLEFHQYAQHVADHLASLGYRPVDNPAEATLLVHFGYGVDQGRERVTTTPGFYDPFYSPWYSYPGFYRGYHGHGYIGYPYAPWGFGWYDPFFGGPDIDSYTVYTSGIDLKIDRAADGARLFEGKAEAVSTSNHLQYLVPNLVEAMFTDFPGNSGETVRISIAPEKKPVKRGY